MTLFRREMAAPAAPKPRLLTFTLQRLDPFGAALHGDLYAHGQRVAVTLENAAKAIPAGRYQIVMTESARAKTGSLWSPREDHKLPLVCDVKDREGIRLHAANRPEQLEGCIALGAVRDGDAILKSQVSVIKVMAMIDAAAALGEQVWLEVHDA